MTRDSRVGWTLLMLLAWLVVPNVAHAYIDPGTTQSLFAILAPVLALFGLFLGYLLWPFRYAIGRLFRRSKKPTDSPDGPDEQEAG